LNVDIISLHEKWPHVDGAWTILPIIEEYCFKFFSIKTNKNSFFLSSLNMIYRKKFELFLFCNENSRVDFISFNENVLNNIHDFEKVNGNINKDN
jgi:hypothetical protein